jgi:hypothetical protein
MRPANTQDGTNSALAPKETLRDCLAQHARWLHSLKHTGRTSLMHRELDVKIQRVRFLEQYFDRTTVQVFLLLTDLDDPDLLLCIQACETHLDNLLILQALKDLQTSDDPDLLANAVSDLESLETTAKTVRDTLQLCLYNRTMKRSYDRSANSSTLALCEHGARLALGKEK